MTTGPTAPGAPSLSRYRVANHTDIGKSDHRAMNEDSSGFAYDEQTDSWIAFIADGMGGMALGDRASKAAGQSFLDTFPPDGLSEEELADWLIDRTWIANSAVVEALQGANGGCTFTALVIRDNFVYVAHVGDTRAYVFDGVVLRRLTRDHSVAEALARSGVASEDEVESARSQLLRALGVTQERSPDYVDTLDAVHPGLHRYRLMPGSTVVLCSDGLWGVVDNDTIEQEVRSIGDDPSVLSARLVAIALERNTQDNTTALVIRAPESSPSESDAASTIPVRSMPAAPTQLVPAPPVPKQQRAKTKPADTAPKPTTEAPQQDEPHEPDESIAAVPDTSDPTPEKFEHDPEDHDVEVLAVPPNPRGGKSPKRARFLGVGAALSVCAVVGLAFAATGNKSSDNVVAAGPPSVLSRSATTEPTDLAPTNAAEAPAPKGAGAQSADPATKPSTDTQAADSVVKPSGVSSVEESSVVPVTTGSGTPNVAKVNGTSRCEGAKKDVALRAQDLIGLTLVEVDDVIAKTNVTISDRNSLPDGAVIASVLTGRKELLPCASIANGSVIEVTTSEAKAIKSTRGTPTSAA